MSAVPERLVGQSADCRHVSRCTEEAGNDNTHAREHPQGTEAVGRDPSLNSEKFATYDSVSSDIQSLKDEVDQLKAQRFGTQESLTPSWYAGTKKALATSAPIRGSGSANGSVRSKIPALKPKSPASVLLDAHDKSPTLNSSSVSGTPPLGKRHTSNLGDETSEILSHTLTGRALGDAEAQDNSQSASKHSEREQHNAKSTQASPSAELSNGSPHFAQPTVAAAIRRETVRRDSAINHGANTSEISPSKSTRSARQRQPKRATLPGSWTGSTDHQNAEAYKVNSHVTGPVSNDPVTQRQIQQEAGREPIKEQSIRKQPSTSYMSPTKAATHRNMATIGQENAKRASPRISRARPLSQIKAAIPQAKGLMSAGSIVSDSGSEKIITEMNTPQQPARYMSPASKSSSGIIPPDLRRRMTVSSSVADALAQHAKASGFRNIEHTTRKRRETTGDLLVPIRARLNKVGLLAGSISDEKAADHDSPSTAMQSANRVLSQSSQETVEPLKPAMEDKSAFQPPHRRVWAARAAEGANASSAASAPDHSDKVPPPTLRATAAEFMPMFMPMPVPMPASMPMPVVSLPRPPPTTPTSTIRDWDDALKFRDVSQWAELSPDDKRIIMAARHYERTGEVPPPDRRVSRQDQFQALMSQHLATQSGPLLSYAEVYGLGVAAGQKLKPYQVPGTSGLRWIVQGTNGEEAPIHFDERFSSQMMATSRSDYTPPPRGPMPSSESWTIGADASNQKNFGWAGGAGREIKFVGYGPDAERDPNMPVSFNFRGGSHRPYSGNRNETGPRMVGDEHDASPLAPRSKAQWAKLKGYTKVPCGDVNLTAATEMLPIPGPVELAGFCNDCSFSSH